MTKEQLKEGLFIDSQICKTIEKIDMLDPGHDLKIVIQLNDKSNTVIQKFYPDENEKDVFEIIRFVYLEYLKKELQNLREKFKNL